jgi:RimJ/RimL family protein N-acetyltransferase
LDHLPALWSVCDGEEESFSNTRYGPYPTRADLKAQLEDFSTRKHQPFWVVRPTSSRQPEGWLSISDVDQDAAALEIGAIWYAPRLQRSAAATEAAFLLMKHGFETMGYNRVVWRCFTHNVASLRAAARLGFKPEGIWRKGGVLDGRHRDVAWHSLLAPEWSAQKARMEAWLDPTNFDADGRAHSSMPRG